VASGWDGFWLRTGLKLPVSMGLGGNVCTGIPLVTGTMNARQA
jgi:hypothetical protein